jgi:hypothetical protein
MYETHLLPKLPVTVWGVDFFDLLLGYKNIEFEKRPFE